jgi:MFS family permease
MSEMVLDQPGSVSPSARWRVMVAGCLAHITHDGFTDMLYVFFPIWQQSFHLSFAVVGLLKTLFSGSMSAFQIPSGILANKTGIRRLLCAGTLLTSLSLAAAGFTHSVLFLGLLLVMGGMGSSTQHPLVSSAISNIYGGKESRVALSTYNFSGDIGKLILPSAAALLIAYAGWHRAISTLGLFGILAIAVMSITLAGVPLDNPIGKRNAARKGRFAFLRLDRSFSFVSLSGIGIVDSATRTGFLTFLPFLLQAKGADVKIVGLALSLIFAGGATGKFVCGVLASGVGVLRTVVLTELATSACIIGMIGLPLKAALLLCPIAGIALNGTSSVLYGSVPELAPEEYRNEAFALFYTCGIGSGAIAPLLYGVLSDAVGVRMSVLAVSILVLATIPLTLPLRGKV